MNKRSHPIWIVKKDKLSKIIKKSNTFSEAFYLLKVSNKGNNTKRLKKRLLEDNISYTHFKSRKEYSKKFAPDLKLCLIKNSTYNRKSLKRRLIEENILENKCLWCGLTNIWNNKTLYLTLDHINGIKNDNRLENLRLLCPNCHSQTVTFAGRNCRKSKG